MQAAIKTVERSLNDSQRWHDTRSFDCVFGETDDRGILKAEEKLDVEDLRDSLFELQISDYVAAECIDAPDTALPILKLLNDGNIAKRFRFASLR